LGLSYRRHRDNLYQPAVDAIREMLALSGSRLPHYAANVFNDGVADTVTGVAGIDLLL